MKLRARGLARTAAILAVLGVAGSVVLPLIPLWPLMLLEHFRVQYLVVGIIVVAVCGALRLRGWFDAAAIATIINACWVLPDLSSRARPIPDGAPVRVLLLNVHTSSTAFAEVSRLIADVDADVVGLIEVDDRWLAGVAPAIAGYPQRIEKPRNDNFGIALYTRLSMTAAIEHLGTLVPTVVATLDVQGTQLGIVLTHPIPPVTSPLQSSLEAQLDAIAVRTRSLPRHHLVMGDFNATPWSTPFRQLTRATGLCDSRAGFGLQASFPASSTVLRIPIDHVLVSCAIGVRSRRIERDVGSDHLPVVVELTVPR